MPQSKGKLKFHFHNPNSVDEMISYILPILIEANTPKFKQAIQKYADKSAELLNSQQAS
ncbi:MULTISPECIES: hypothetical protein [Caproicibacterium]|uniref:Uncharacterized protein n=1 Tax=Caproicibacterium argilliputei TaxID=3030016 RepID=A0AA97D9Z0_9FIRM|nr:hypothetical protein [Caproicibacterium argilliputei]WOC31765.1 hypothetical protein PXC00_11235 [Caproicibacterium argilliputei]